MRDTKLSLIWILIKNNCGDCPWCYPAVVTRWSLNGHLTLPCGVSWAELLLPKLMSNYFSLQVRLKIRYTQNLGHFCGNRKQNFSKRFFISLTFCKNRSNLRLSYLLFWSQRPFRWNSSLLCGRLNLNSANSADWADSADKGSTQKVPKKVPFYLLSLWISYIQYKICVLIILWQ